MKLLLLETLVLLAPLVLSGILHMIVVTCDLMSFLKIPINEKLFGKNKTLRGFIVMPLLSIPGVFLASWLEVIFSTNTGMNNANPYILGLLLGIFYCLFELPNSYIKRKRGISPGKMSKDNALFHGIIDQADSGFGLIIIYYFMLQSSVVQLFSFMVLGTIIHLLLNYLLYKLGLRKEPL